MLANLLRTGAGTGEPPADDADDAPPAGADAPPAERALDQASKMSTEAEHVVFESLVYQASTAMRKPPCYRAAPLPIM